MKIRGEINKIINGLYSINKEKVTKKEVQEMQSSVDRINSLVDSIYADPKKYRQIESVYSSIISVDAKKVYEGTKSKECSEIVENVKKMAARGIKNIEIERELSRFSRNMRKMKKNSSSQSYYAALTGISDDLISLISKHGMNDRIAKRIEHILYDAHQIKNLSQYKKLNNNINKIEKMKDLYENLESLVVNSFYQKDPNIDVKKYEKNILSIMNRAKGYNLCFVRATADTEKKILSFKKDGKIVHWPLTVTHKGLELKTDKGKILKFSDILDLYEQTGMGKFSYFLEPDNPDTSEMDKMAELKRKLFGE